jgi:hypothetical protein
MTGLPLDGGEMIDVAADQLRPVDATPLATPLAQTKTTSL